MHLWFLESIRDINVLITTGGTKKLGSSAERYKNLS